MARYTQLDAAYQVLRLVGRPMREEEIRDVAIRNGLLRDASAASLRSTIYEHIRTGDRFVRLKDGFGLKEWLQAPDSTLAVQIDDERLGRSLRTWLRALREVNRGIKAPPTADTLCMWTEMCYRLDLRDDVTRTFMLIQEQAATPWLYERARRFYRLCHREGA